MKTNAILRIIIWSLVLVLLISILGAGLLYRNRRVSWEAPTETVIAMPQTEIPVLSEDDYPVTCDTEATVTADGLNVRSAPSSDSTAIAVVEKGDVVAINRGVEIGGQRWLGIYSPVDGWIKAEYVDSLEDVVFYSSEALRIEIDNSSSGTVTAAATEEVNVRSAPSEDATAIGLLQPGDTVTIGRQENVGGEPWAYLADSPVGSGWVMAKYLKSNTSKSANSADISLDATQIREISIEWAAGNITVQPADVDTIQVSESSVSDPKYAMVWKQSGDKLTIQFCDGVKLDFNFGINLNNVVSKDLMILVPMGWECDSLEIDAASATLDVKNLVIKEMDFDGASGTCVFENCVIDWLDLDTASGDIYFTGSLETLDCDAASASVIAVFDNVPSRIDMDSMSGDLDITLPSNAGFTVSMDGLSTDFFSDFGYSQNREGYYCGDGRCKITMDAMSGDLYLREYKEADAVPSAPTAPDAPTAPEAPAAPEAPTKP